KDRDPDGRAGHRSGVAGRLAAGQVAAGLLRLALAQAFGIQRVEVDRLQQERGEAAGLDQFADQLARVGIQHVRALGAEQRVEHVGFEAGQAEHARLLHLDHVHRIAVAFAGGAGQGHAQHHFVGVLAQALDALVEVHVDLRLGLLVEHQRRLGRLERDVLDVDLLDAELRAGGLLRGLGAAIEGLVGHPGTAPVSGSERGRLSHFETQPRPLASGRSACSQPPMPPSSTNTRSKPAFFSRLAASPALCPVLHTSTTGRPLAAARRLFSGSNWLISTFFEPGMWPFSKSAIARRSTTRALSRLTSAVTSAGRTTLKLRVRRAISVTMIAPVRPAKASASIWLRPAKAINSWKSTADRLCGRGRDCRTGARRRAGALTGTAPATGARDRPRAGALFARPEVRQPAGDPPGFLLRVVAPLLGVAHGAFGHGVAVDHADLDLAHRLGFAGAG